jgi:DNA-binding NtrC family response regulator
MNCANIGFKKVKALILEDDTNYMEEIKSNLNSIENIEYELTYTYNSFKTNIEKKEFDLVSIDWQIGELYLGQHVIELVKEKQPDVAKIVLTIHDQMRNDALSTQTHKFSDVLLCCFC